MPPAKPSDSPVPAESVFVGDVAPAPLPPPPGAIAEGLATAEPTEPVLKKVPASYIWFQVLAQFGVFVAFITPLGISLSIRLAGLAPGHEEYLGYITGTGSLFALLLGPVFPILSDRTRTRLGRRRPWMIGGMILGVFSLVVMGSATSVVILGLGWVLAQLGWGQVLANLQISMADKLPEEQRGKVAGLSGFATQVAPVVGVILASQFTGDPLLLFLVPGVIGVIFTTLFIALIKEADSRGLVFADKMTVATAFARYVFNPRAHRDFSLVWAGRFLFYFGLTLNTTFTAFFFASRLGVGVDQVASVLVSLSLMGIVATTVGALGGGFLSDRLKRRRSFVLVASIIFGAGILVQAFASELPVLFAGSVIAAAGIGAFSAVDQALLLDVLPNRGQEAGRFMGIAGLATGIPQAIAPFLAPFILAIGFGVTAGEKNYTLLYVIAALVTVAGGLVVLRVRSVR